jgi:hypothetical protein
VTTRLPQHLVAELDKVASQLPATSRAGLVRVLVERGLRDLDGDARRLVAPPPEQSPATTGSKEK